MAETIINLSGLRGLSDNFFGDSDMITPQPNLRVGEEGQMASGLFNPYLRKGYLAPITTTSTTLTLDQTITTQLGSSLYDPVNNDSFFADRGRQIFTAGDLTDYTLTRAEQLDATDAVLHDLEIYQVNDERKLFFSYNSKEPTGEVSMSVLFSTITDAALTTFTVRPSGATIPVLEDFDTEAESSSSTTITESIPVSGSSDLVTVVFAGTIGGADGPDSATIGGNAMTSGGSGSTSALGLRYRYFYYVNPTPGNPSVEVTYGGAVTNRFIMGFTFSGAHQTSPLSGTDTEADEDVNSLIATPTMSSLNHLIMTIALSLAGTHTPGNGQDVVEETVDETFIRTSISSYDTSQTRARVGITDLPVANTNENWIGETALNGVRPITTSNYNFLRTADNGFAYWFQDNHVHKIDGTITGGENGIVTKDVLIFPSYFRLTDAVDYRSRMHIVLHQYPVDTTTTTQNLFSGKCGIYIWNRISTQLNGSDFIEIPGVKEIKKIYISPDGVLKIICVSDTGLVEVRQFGYNDSGGVVFNTLKELGIGAFSQFVDGLQVVGDKAIWLANDGKLYCEKGGYVTQLYQAKTPASTSANALTNIYSGAILYGSGAETASTGFRSNKQGVVLSYLDSTTPYVIKVYPFDLTTGSNGNQTPNQGDVYSTVQFIPITSVLRRLRIYNAPVASTGSTVIATVKLYFNQSTTVGMTKSITLDEAKRGYVDFSLNKPYIHSVQIEVEWATGTPLGADMYLPSIAVLSHDEAETKTPDNG